MGYEHAKVLLPATIVGYWYHCYCMAGVEGTTGVPVGSHLETYVYMLRKYPTPPNQQPCNKVVVAVVAADIAAPRLLRLFLHDLFFQYWCYES